MRIAVVNLKGGVGKTVTSVHLAACLAERGRTLLVDADPQQSALSWSENAEPELPFAVVALPSTRIHTHPQVTGEDYAHVVVDTPPGNEAIVRSAALAADVVIVPMPPSSMDLDRLRATLELLAEVEPVNPAEVRVLLTRVRANTVLGRDVQALLSELGVPRLGANVRLRELYAGAFGSRPTSLDEYGAVLEEVEAPWVST